MSAVDEARNLLTLVKEHLRAVEGMNDPEVFSDSVFGFHAQQAAELALKAWLSLKRIAYPRTHDLSRLLHLLGEAGVDSAAFRDLVGLNPFAVQFRYGVTGPDEPIVDRNQIRHQITALHDRVAELLRNEA